MISEMWQPGQPVRTRSRPTVVPAGVVLLVCVALLAAGCASGDTDAGGSRDGRSPGRLRGSITVAAAASLTEPFDAIVERFERDHPGTTVRVGYDSSGTLAEQVVGRAPVDVFASADREHMDTVARAGRVDGTPRVFATNRLAIAVGRGNPDAVTGLADLRDLGTVAVCVESAPCGRLAGEALERAHVDLPAGKVTRGQNVKATITALTEGGADAAIVYATDVRAAGSEVTGVTITPPVTTRLPIAVIEGTKHPRLARAFVAAVRSDAGREELRRAGFGDP